MMVPSKDARRARRRIAFRLAQAERLVREAAARVPDAVPAADVARDAGGLLELADVLGFAVEAYAPPSRWPVLPEAGKAQRGPATATAATTAPEHTTP